MAIVQHDLFESKREMRGGRKFTTGPAPKGKKQCTKCRKVKPIAAFSLRAKSPDGRYPQCKECIRASDTKYRASSKAASWLKHYGITEHAYWELFEGQRGVCAICKQPETRLHKGCLSHLSVDHDHASGRIRGLLCAMCNTAIGHFGDDIARLEAAIEYLKHSRDQ